MIDFGVQTRTSHTASEWNKDKILFTSKKKTIKKWGI